MSMTTFGSRLSTCNRVLQKERLLTYGVISPGQSRGISPLQGGGGVILGEVKARPKDIISFSLDYISKSKEKTSNPSSSPISLDTPARPADSIYIEVSIPQPLSPNVCIYNYIYSAYFPQQLATMKSPHLMSHQSMRIVSTGNLLDIEKNNKSIGFVVEPI